MSRKHTANFARTTILSIASKYITFRVFLVEKLVYFTYFQVSSFRLRTNSTNCAPLLYFASIVFSALQHLEGRFWVILGDSAI
jgi:hypothetical protein